MILHQDQTARKSVGVRFLFGYKRLIVNLFRTAAAGITLVKAVNATGSVN